MTRQEAIAAVRAGVDLALAFSERWVQGVYIGWLTSGDIRIRGTGYRVLKPGDPEKVGACGCVLGLSALHVADGRLPLWAVENGPLDELEKALGEELYREISRASEHAADVEGMAATVTKILNDAEKEAA